MMATVDILILCQTLFCASIGHSINITLIGSDARGRTAIAG